MVKMLAKAIFFLVRGYSTDSRSRSAQSLNSLALLKKADCKPILTLQSCVLSMS